MIYINIIIALGVVLYSPTLAKNMAPMPDTITVSPQLPPSPATVPTTREELQQVLQTFTQKLDDLTTQIAHVATTATSTIKHDPQVPALLIPYVTKIQEIITNKESTQDRLNQLNKIHAEIKTAGLPPLTQPLNLEKLIEEYTQKVKMAVLPITPSKGKQITEEEKTIAQAAQLVAEAATKKADDEKKLQADLERKIQQKAAAKTEKDRHTTET